MTETHTTPLVPPLGQSIDPTNGHATGRPPQAGAGEPEQKHKLVIRPRTEWIEID